MGRMKDTLGDAPPTLGAVWRLGAYRLIITCPPPCKRQAWIEIANLGLPDDTPFAEIATKKRFVCSTCDRRAGPAAVSIDWGVSASTPSDGR